MPDSGVSMDTKLNLPSNRERVKKADDCPGFVKKEFYKAGKCQIITSLAFAHIWCMQIL